MLTPYKRPFHSSDVLSVPKFMDGSVQYFEIQTKTNWLSILGWFFVSVQVGVQLFQMRRRNLEQNTIKIFRILSFIIWKCV